MAGGGVQQGGVAGGGFQQGGVAGGVTAPVVPPEHGGQPESGRDPAPDSCHLASLDTCLDTWLDTDRCLDTWLDTTPAPWLEGVCVHSLHHDQTSLHDIILFFFNDQIFFVNDQIFLCLHCHGGWSQDI